MNDAVTSNDAVVDPIQAGQFIANGLQELHKAFNTFDVQFPIDDNYMSHLRQGQVPPRAIDCYTEDITKERDHFEALAKLGTKEPTKEESKAIVSHFLNSQKPLNAHSLFGDLSIYTHVYNEWVKEVASLIKGKRVLEIGAGRYGFLAYAFQQAGIECIPTDPLKNDNPPFQFIHVERLDYRQAIEKYTDQCDVLLIGWAEHAPWTKNYTKLWKKHKPEGITILVGEHGGCCGTQAMYKPLQNDKLVYDKRIMSPRMLKVYAEVYSPIRL